MNGARITLVPLSEVFPESALADAIDQAIESGLPAVPGLDEAHTPQERAEAFARVIEAQRTEFIAMYGEPFGWERRAEPRVERPFGVFKAAGRVAVSD